MDESIRLLETVARAFDALTQLVRAYPWIGAALLYMPAAYALLGLSLGGTVLAVLLATSAGVVAPFAPGWALLLWLAAWTSAFMLVALRQRRRRDEQRHREVVAAAAGTPIPTRRIRAPAPLRAVSSLLLPVLLLALAAWFFVLR